MSSAPERPRRVIPCLDVSGGRVVKGVNFVQLRDAGDPVEIAARYDEQGADELVFLDITATTEGRGLLLPIIREVMAAISIPLTVGGGVRSVDDIALLLEAGATAVGVGSAAVARPALVSEAAQRFGSERIVVAVDARARGAEEESARDPGWDVYTRGGRHNTGLDALAWADEMAARGVGQILLTSMDRDGTKSGFDLVLTRAVSDRVPVPVIASGGAGTAQHMADGVLQGGADAVLAAGVFHYGDLSIPAVKRYMASCGIPVRI